MLDETVDEEIKRKERYSLHAELYRTLVGEDFEDVLNHFKKEQKSKLLLIC